MDVVKGREVLRRILREINGRGYGNYKALKGQYSLGRFVLTVDHVQPDPFAPGSSMRVSVGLRDSGIPPHCYSSRIRRIALCDFLARRFHRGAVCHSRQRGTGRSGQIAIPRPGQEVLQRSSVVIKGEYIEVRFTMGLPARGRSIDAYQAEEMFLKDLPEIVEGSLFYENLSAHHLSAHIAVTEDAEHLRGVLDSHGLVAFVADGAVLPRASGVEDTPLKGDRVVPFQSPPSMRVRLTLPNRGEITGMGIPRGVTLIIGGGYHGKSTLLRAIERGIYNHIPGDGREFVVTRKDAVKIRAEDGRRIEKVDISPFITNIPFGEDTSSFSTDNASGSTSQAANIMEALEIGTGLLLIDEDTSATNFMIRDQRMQRLLPKRFEPITPFIDRVRALYRDLGVSTILVLGGSGEYFDVADRVVCMIQYRPEDMTREAKDISRACGGDRPLVETSFGGFRMRVPLRESLDPSRGKKTVKVAGKGLNRIVFGRYEIDLSCVEQIVDPCQCNAIAHAMVLSISFMDGRTPLRGVIERTMQRIEQEGLDILSLTPTGGFAEFRGLELASAINRLRSFRVKQTDG